MYASMIGMFGANSNYPWMTYMLAEYWPFESTRESSEVAGMILWTSIK